MSMNVHIFAERDAIANNKKFIHTIEFNAVQIPTEDTRKIVASDNPIEAYKEWIIALNYPDIEEPIFDSYDDEMMFALGNYNKPLKTEITNYGKTHLENLQEWLNECKDSGFIVKVEMI